VALIEALSGGREVLQLPSQERVNELSRRDLIPMPPIAWP
jgi:hypothetical protein